MTKSVVFMSYDQNNSPYMTSYFYPLLVGAVESDGSLLILHFRKNIDMKTFELNIHEYTKGNLEGSSTKAGKQSLSGGLLVVMSMIRVLRKYETENSTLLYRSIGGGFMAAMAMLSLKKFKKRIYDSDGLAIDERIENGLLHRFSIKHFALRIIEMFSLRFADTVLVRSPMTKSELNAKYAFTKKIDFLKLSNGRSTVDFRPGTIEERTRIRNSLGIDSSDIVFVYSGSLGPQYMLDQIYDVFLQYHLHNPKSILIFLTYEPDYVVAKYIEPNKLQISNSVKSLRVQPNQVGEILRICDIGFSLRSNSNSMLHVAPLKLREYMLSGVPVIYTKNTGDDFEINLNCGYAIDDCYNLDISSICNWIENHVVKNRENSRHDTREFGLQRFSLNQDIQIMRENFI